MPRPQNTGELIPVVVNEDDLRAVEEADFLPDIPELTNPDFEELVDEEQFPRSR